LPGHREQYDASAVVRSDHTKCGADDFRSGASRTIDEEKGSSAMCSFCRSGRAGWSAWIKDEGEIGEAVAEYADDPPSQTVAALPANCGPGADRQLHMATALYFILLFWMLPIKDRGADFVGHCTTAEAIVLSRWPGSAPGSQLIAD